MEEVKVLDEEIKPQGDGQLSPRQPCPPFSVAVGSPGAYNQALRSQWESAFKKNTSLPRHFSFREAFLQEGEEGGGQEGDEEGGHVSQERSPRKENEGSKRTKATEKSESEAVNGQQSGSGAVPMEETIQKLSEEVGRCVKQTAVRSPSCRHLASSDGEQEDPAPRRHSLNLRPLRSATDIFSLSGSGSGRKVRTKKAKLSGKGRTKAKRRSGSARSSESERSDDERGTSSSETVPVVRGEVPSHVYYFAKRNRREGWLIKQGGRVQSWKRRYFILQAGGEAEPAMLYYFDRLPFKNLGTQAKGALLMREVLTIEEADLPGRPFSFALCTSYRKFWLQAAGPEEKSEWLTTFSNFLLENLSTSLEKVEINPRLKDENVYTLQGNRPTLLKPLVENEEANYHRLQLSRNDIPSFPSHLFALPLGVALVEGREHLCLEDYLSNLKHPCVCTLRLGVKPKSEGQEAALGFKFKQIRMYDKSSDQFIKKNYPRTSGRKRPEKATKILLRFLCDGQQIHYAVVDVLLAKLAELIFWLERDAHGEFLSFLLIKTNLVMAYDTSHPEGADSIQVKIVDLDRCIRKPESQEGSSSDSFLHGARRLHQLLDKIYYEKSLAAKVIGK